MPAKTVLGYETIMPPTDVAEANLDQWPVEDIPSEAGDLACGAPSSPAGNRTGKMDTRVIIRSTVANGTQVPD